jgi:hypothetical protein
MVFYATFNNISVLSWRSVLLVEETGVPGENDRPTQVTDTLYQIISYRMHIDLARFELTMLVVMGIDCIGNYNSTTIRSRPPSPLWIKGIRVRMDQHYWKCVFTTKENNISFLIILFTYQMFQATVYFCFQTTGLTICFIVPSLVYISL